MQRPSVVLSANFLLLHYLSGCKADAAAVHFERQWRAQRGLCLPSEVLLEKVKDLFVQWDVDAFADLQADAAGVLLTLLADPMAPAKRAVAWRATSASLA